jgi:hypothetical protein
LELQQTDEKLQRDELLATYARQKLGASRPHRTDEDRRKIERELRINIYSSEEYCCTGCAAAGTSETTLRLCARCQRAWFCSRECQEQAWEAEHKRVCSKKPRPLFAHDDEKEGVEESFEDWEKLVGSWGEGRCFHALVRDTATGRLFESLTDRDMYFLPSELKLVPKKFKTDAELFIAARSMQDLTL